MCAGVGEAVLSGGRTCVQGSLTSSRGGRCGLFVEEAQRVREKPQGQEGWEPGCPFVYLTD